MVKSAYTEETELNPADFTGIAGQGAAAWGDVLGKASTQIQQIGEEKAKAEAAMDGMTEGLKGADAQMASNLFAPGRAKNAKIMSTAITTVTNQASAEALSIFQDVTKNGFTNTSYKDFGQRFGDYGQKLDDGATQALKTPIKMVMQSIKNKYDVLISKHAMAQSLQQQKFNDLSNGNKLNVNILDSISKGSSSEDINNAINLSEEFNRNASYTSSTKANFQEYLTRGVSTSLGMKTVNDLTTKITSIGSSSGSIIPFKSKEAQQQTNVEQLNGHYKELNNLMDPNYAKKVVNHWREVHPILKNEPIDVTILRLQNQASTGISKIGKLNTEAQSAIEQVRDINKNNEIPTPDVIGNLTNQMGYLTGRQRGAAQDQIDLTTKKRQLFLARSTNSLLAGNIISKANNGEYSPVVNQGVIKYNNFLAKKIHNDGQSVINSNHFLQQQMANSVTSQYPGQTANVNALVGASSDKDWLSRRAEFVNASPNGRQIEASINQQNAYAQKQMGTPASQIKYQTLEQGKSYANTLGPLSTSDQVNNINSNYTTGFSPSKMLNLLVASDAGKETVSAAFIASNHNPNSMREELDNFTGYDELRTTAKDTHEGGYNAIEGQVFKNPYLATLRTALSSKYYDPVEKVIKADLYHELVTGELGGGFFDPSTGEMNKHINSLLMNHGLVLFASSVGQDGTSVNVVMPNKMENPFTPGSYIPFDERAFRDGLPSFQPTEKNIQDFHVPALYAHNPSGWRDEVLGGRWINSGIGQVKYITASGIPLFLKPNDKTETYPPLELDALTVQMQGAYLRDHPNISSPNRKQRPNAKQIARAKQATQDVNIFVEGIGTKEYKKAVKLRQEYKAQQELFDLNEKNSNE